MRPIINLIRRILWFPLAVITCIPFMLAMLMLVFLYDRPDSGWLFFVWIVVLGITTPFEMKLRSSPSAPHMRMPKDRTITTSLVRMIKRKASATGRSAILRRLPPALRSVLKQPANQKPAAVVFSERRQAAKNAEAASDAREVA